MRNLSNQWWGEFLIDLGKSALWEIGPTRIAVQRQPREWLVAHQRSEEQSDRQEWRFTSIDELDEDYFDSVSRFVCHSTPGSVSIRPALADRSVVSRPFTPFTVPMEENATIYVSTPLWFVLTTGTPAQTLFELPIQRPSDTWFGSSTLEGETCYASRTHGRLNLENLATYPFRAVTQVHIHNKGATPLLVERLNVPVPYLSLFLDKDGRIWTETVTVVQTRGTSLAEFNIERQPPQVAAEASLITNPRLSSQKGMLIRAFGALKLQGLD
jgi:hypothetical protein